MSRRFVQELYEFVLFDFRYKIFKVLHLTWRTIAFQISPLRIWIQFFVLEIA